MPVNVLYLDDEQHLCNMFSEFIGSDDVIVKTFTEPNEAVVSCAMSPPDIFFMDFRLMGVTGDEVGAFIDSRVVKVLVTGDLDADTSTHFDYVVFKPFKLSEIKSIVEQVRKSG